ncbi:MAG: transglycosylase domain-containing protein [Burkholderiales bacterium]
MKRVPALVIRSLGRLIGLLLLCLLALQLYFAGRIALMRLLDPASTTFERSEIARLAAEKHEVAWSQSWRDYGHISVHLKRAVIASEDAGFAEHNGVEWDAIEKAWERNQQAEAQAQRLADQQERRRKQAGASGRAAPAQLAPRPAPRIVGGSTISQQLAKNLFLSGERTVGRKAQEFVITVMLEALLPKQRLLEIYLNHVEWGEGVFGAQAAARHYFRVDAAALSPAQAARLAVMLPAPKRFERRPGSAYVVGRAATVQARMGAVEVP